MQDPNCIFCKIIAGQIPCAKVYKTDNILAFMDIAPVTSGHCLVIVKDHHPTLFDLDPQIGQELLDALQKVGKAVMDATSATGLNVGQNNYRAAGQLVDHAHFHLIPRKDEDGLSLWPQTPYDSNDEMLRLADAISQRIS